MITIKKVIIRDSTFHIKRDKLERLRTRMAKLFKTTTESILFDIEEPVEDGK